MTSADNYALSALRVVSRNQIVCIGDSTQDHHLPVDSDYRTLPHKVAPDPAGYINMAAGRAVVRIA